MNEPSKRPPTSVTVRYDGVEDRILAAVGVGPAGPRGFWLTRRLALKFFEAANVYLERTSPLASKTPTDLRGDLADMDRQVSLARTQGAVGKTPGAAVERAREASDLLAEISISAESGEFRLRLRGSKGGEVVVGCTRAELQRVVYMFEQEATKAEWIIAATVAAPQIDPNAAKRRAN